MDSRGTAVRTYKGKFLIHRNLPLVSDNRHYVISIEFPALILLWFGESLAEITGKLQKYIYGQLCG
jgi:hypothetical protein